MGTGTRWIMGGLALFLVATLAAYFVPAPSDSPNAGVQGHIGASVLSGLVLTLGAGAELTPAFRRTPSVCRQRTRSPVVQERGLGAHSEDAHRISGHRAARLASRRPSRADPIGAKAPVISDVILRMSPPESVRAD